MDEVVHERGGGDEAINGAEWAACPVGAGNQDAPRVGDLL
jgi:hypothetical protein